MDEPRVSRWAYVRALLAVRALWPVPGLLALVALLPFLPESAWHPAVSSRRTLSAAELAMVLSLVGALGYWLLPVLDHLGLLHGSHRLGMREPSEAEQRIVTGVLRAACFLMVYAGVGLLARIAF